MTDVVKLIPRPRILIRSGIYKAALIFVGAVTAMACGDPNSAAGRCPAHPLALPTSAVAPGDQSILYPDANKIIAYGSAHPDIYGGFEYIDPAHPELRVAFTRNVAAIRTDLSKSLQYPERIQFVKGDYTIPYLMAVQQKIFAVVPHNELSMVGPVFQYDAVVLKAGESKTAASLIQQFGSAVYVSVGSNAYVPAGC